MTKQKQPLVKNIYTADPSAHVFEGMTMETSIIWKIITFSVWIM